MNILNVLTEIEKTDPEVYERLDTRRDAMKSFSKWGGRIALTALPLMLGGMFKKAYGQTSSSITDVLNFALTLEYLEAEFYTMGAASGIVPAGPATGAINTIRDHENQHVAFLKSVISSMGATPVSKPTFDFTAGNGSNNGPFAGVFSNYGLFLAVAQTFEDTGVRAYKGQAANLISNNTVLNAALQIHSVEARHASHIRQMRKAQGASVKPWITGKDTGGIGSGVQASYNGEETTTQAGINIVNINGQNISLDAASESFDEPLDKAAILAIVDPFIV